MESTAEIHADSSTPEGHAGGLDCPADHQPLKVEDLLELSFGHIYAEDPGERGWVLETVEVRRGVDLQQPMKRRRLRPSKITPADEAFLPEEGENPLGAQRSHGNARDTFRVSRVIHEEGPG